MKITMSEGARNKIVGGIFLVVAIGAIVAVTVDWGADKKSLKGSDDDEDPRARYEVVRVYKNSKRTKVLAPKLKRDQAIAKVNSFPESKTSMVIFRKI